MKLAEISEGLARMAPTFGLWQGGYLLARQGCTRWQPGVRTVRATPSGGVLMAKYRL